MNGTIGTTREAFGERSITTSAETHTSALVAAAQASVQARFVVALQRPRSWEDVRVRLLRECDRPGFARVARYNKPIGKGVQGPSIRFAEACLRYAGNFDAPMSTTFEDRERRIVHISVIDLESNASYAVDISIEKTVERRDSKDRVVVGERTNSTGEKTFIVEATEDELLNKQNSLVSKAARTLILRMIPGDLVEEAQDRCKATLHNEAAADPAGERKRLCDAFASVGVFPGALAQYLGHPLDGIQPAEIVDLRMVYETIRDGEATWGAVIANKRGVSAEPATADKPAAPSRAEALEEKLAAATTDEECKAVGQAVVKYSKAKALTDAERDALVAAIRVKREALKAPAASPKTEETRAASAAPVDDGKAAILAEEQRIAEEEAARANAGDEWEGGRQ